KASPVDIAGLDDEIDCADPHADDIDQVTTKEALDRGLEQLVPEQRDTVILHEIQGCSDKETAAILNVSVGTVKSRLHRAKQKMRDTLLQGTITQVRSC
ncbi:MAG TPA: RNA polymerase sigma factor, partial [Pseudomonadales bacterium]|nr:RNA polymerase sigma factor [Pseudomonadales bacterium]